MVLATHYSMVIATHSSMVSTGYTPTAQEGTPPIMVPNLTRVHPTSVTSNKKRAAT